jgi:hypothetical protein
MAERDATPEPSGRAAVLAISLVVVALLGGSVWGWSYAGPLGGLLGVLLGTAIGAVAFTIIRASATTGRLDGRVAPDVRELPPDRAVQVLTALMSGGASEGPLAGGLLADIGKVRAQAEAGDLPGALARLEALARQHAHSPAIPAELARLLAGDPARTDERMRAASKALTLAIRGGGSRLAVDVYERLDERERERLELDDATREQLARIFATRGDEATASRLRVRSLPS